MKIDLDQLPHILNHILDINIKKTYYDETGYYCQVKGTWYKLDLILESVDKQKKLSEVD